MRRTHLHLTDPQHARLRDLAGRTGLNVAELVRRALDDFLGRQGDDEPTSPAGTGCDLGRSPAASADRRNHAHVPPARD